MTLNRIEGVEVKLNFISRMKIFLIITLYLISGQVGHSELTGYSGGRVIILSTLQWDLGDNKYICKLEQNHCSDYIINKSSKRHQEYTDRFMLFRNQEGLLRVLITDLKLQDAGTYRIGIENQSSYDVNLDVRTKLTDSCCGMPKTVTAYRGQNISIICNYPLEYKEFDKYVYKDDRDNTCKDIRAIITNSQKDRFSISYERSTEVVSVNISDLREADGGLYLCGVKNKDQPILYYSLFPEIQLNITGTSEEPLQGTCVIISVCVCVALLLFGGFALMIYILIYKRTQGSECSSKRRFIDSKQVPTVYENILANLPPYENLNIAMRLNHQKLDSFTSQSDPTYQTLDPLTNQSNSGYASLTNTTDQSHSHYQRLNPRTQTNSIYHTLQF